MTQIGPRGPILGVTAHPGVVPTPWPVPVFPAPSTEGQKRMTQIGPRAPNLGVTAHPGVVPTPWPGPVFPAPSTEIQFMLSKALAVLKVTHVQNSARVFDNITFLKLCKKLKKTGLGPRPPGGRSVRWRQAFCRVFRGNPSGSPFYKRNTKEGNSLEKEVQKEGTPGKKTAKSLAPP